MNSASRRRAESFAPASSPSMVSSGACAQRNSTAGVEVTCSRLAINGRYSKTVSCLTSASVRLVRTSQNSAFTKCKIAGWLRKFSLSGKPAGFGRFLFQAAEHTGIGAAEAINRLFIVADEKQFSVVGCSPQSAWISSTCKGSVSWHSSTNSKRDLRSQSLLQLGMRRIDKQLARSWRAGR